MNIYGEPNWKALAGVFLALLVVAAFEVWMIVWIVSRAGAP